MTYLCSSRNSKLFEQALLVFQLPSVKWTVEPILIQSARGDVYLEDSLKISALHLSSVSKPASLNYIINSLTIILCIDSAG